MIVEEPRDKPPKAVITPEGSREVYLPDSTVALDASKSSDDNGIEQFLWSIASQPTGIHSRLYSLGFSCFKGLKYCR